MDSDERHLRRSTLADALRPHGPVTFAISERRDGDDAVLVIGGELDALTAPRFSTQVDNVVRRSAANLTIDLRELQFIDSTALHILLNAHRRLTRQSRRLRVIVGDGPVRRVFELARLVETLGVTGADADHPGAR